MAEDHSRRQGPLNMEESQPLRSGRSNPSKNSRMGNGTGPFKTKPSSWDWSRICQWTLLMVVIIVAGTLTYHFSSQKLEEEFSDEFQHLSNQVLSEASYRLNNHFSLLETFSITVTASTASQTWPLITIPKFGVLEQNYRNQSHAQVIAFLPIIYGGNQTAWNNYTAKREGITPYIYKEDVDGERVEDTDNPSIPLWQVSPADAPPNNINYNILQTTWLKQLIEASLQKQKPLLSIPINVQTLLPIFPGFQDGHGELEQIWSVLAQPVWSSQTEPHQQIGGFLLSVLPWSSFLQEILWDVERPVHCVVQDSFGYSFTYQIDGAKVRFLGTGDSFHDSRWTPISAPFNSGGSPTSGQRHLQYSSACNYTMAIYPTAAFYGYYVTDDPEIYTAVVVAIFAGVAVWFLCCDCFRRYRKNRVSDIEDMMMDATVRPTSGSRTTPRKSRHRTPMPQNNKQRLNAFLNNGEATAPDVLDDDVSHTNQSEEFDLVDSKPVADLFPSATVMMADVSGFTAWASVRQPSQVFYFLETIYHTFDILAKQRKVFKVETIGDCYVAVCGLPAPRSDHAVVIAQYAKGCLRKFKKLTHKLEEKLGPDTSELSLRVGLHSGAVVAGVLRSEQARFQLFGETVNTASWIESTGKGGKIHLSKETANLVTQAGKGHWLQTRRDTILNKKGEMQTFWLLDEKEAHSVAELSGLRRPQPVSQRSTSSLEDSSFGEEDGWEGQSLNTSLLRLATERQKSSVAEERSKTKRLVGWNCEVMMPLLKMIVARREAEKSRRDTNNAIENVQKLEGLIGSNNNVIDEVEEIIDLPEFQYSNSDPDKAKLRPGVENQLKEYVTIIASLYRDNPFHNFEHASHVTMSAVKLLSRIVAPDDVVDVFGKKKKKEVAESLHDHTYGITSDPLTQFAIVLSSLIHDVDHRGVPNFLLIKEDPELVAVYYNKSVAEQNSVDIAWELLMDKRFEALRSCIYSNETELKRFRSLVANCVMSTDIFDKELSALRKNRWHKAFKVPDSEATQEDINRKATIVIEHLIQASDVSHTMQHWHVYLKWNERLFCELYTAYRTGRSDKDPSSGWYTGELGFFDNYVIPLAKKLEDCGVFGVSSDEYLNYATANRNEWEAKGKEIVENMIDKYSVMMDVDEPSRLR